jgi:AcrR family transcriptional regulator
MPKKSTRRRADRSLMGKSGKTLKESDLVPAGARRRRMPRDAREKTIVAEATLLFSEFGLSADMRELARRLNLTHPALFRYFPTKDALIARVYEDTFVGRWNPEWEMIIADRHLSISDRLSRLYKMYAKVALSYEWVRLYTLAGLHGLDAPRKFYGFLEKHIILPLCEEIRLSYGYPSSEQFPLQVVEKQLIWSFHSQIFYLGIRKHIFRMDIPDNIDEVIDALISVLMNGLGPTLQQQFKRAHLKGGRVRLKNPTSLVGRSIGHKTARMARASASIAAATSSRS